MYKVVRDRISQNLQNTIGWRTNRKLLVIESDDWGSVHMPSITSYNNLLKQGIRVDKSPYNRLDKLESEQDILALFDVFEQIKDNKGNKLKITANTIMANPYFDKISASGFSDYHYINLEESYRHYNGNSDVLQLIKEGMDNQLFIPQLHGREHLHPMAWLKALREGDKDTTIAFKEGVWGHPTSYFNNKMNFSSAFHILDKDNLDFAKTALFEAAAMFENVFGFKSESFIAPRYIWDKNIEEILNGIGVKFIQGKIVQVIPIQNNPNKFKRKINYLGKKNEFGQLYLTRNVFFEPGQNSNFDWVSDALNRIRIAYRWNKPAIISMHRINFMGGLEVENRTTNLNLLKILINKVISEYPEVEFVSSNELGKIINNE